MISRRAEGDVQLVLMENDILRALVAPGIGGRVVSLLHRSSGREFLWRNPKLELAACPPGSEYDPHFAGGIDELLPCDIPETICGIDCPDHGELWTLPLTAAVAGDRLVLGGRLPLFGLSYHREMRLEENRLVCDYRIMNDTDAERIFLWKLHGALAVRPGDRVTCAAQTARVADPEWSRRASTEPFAWPVADGHDLSVIPEPDGSTDFCYLYDLSRGSMGMQAIDGATIECVFDPGIFPCCWYFASHGGMDGAVTAVLEPCTTMPVSVNEAASAGFCSRLAPGEQIVTSVTWVVTGPREDR